MSRFLSFALALVVATAALAEGIDLSKEYPATLDWTKLPRSLPWTCEADDVWALSSFTYSCEDLKVKLAASNVAIGKHGTNALWACVIPDEPGKLRSDDTPEGERVKSVYLRFHPARIAELFPPETVRARGSPEILIWAKRITAWNMPYSWQFDGLPVVPRREMFIIDVQTVDGPRRLFTGEPERTKANYKPFFAARGLPKLVKAEPEAALTTFVKVWKAFHSEYPMFVIRPQVDWAKLRDEYQPRVKGAKTTYQLATVIAEMLAKLEDLQVTVKLGQEVLPVFDRPRPHNAAWSAVEKALDELDLEPQSVAAGRTNDGIGYMRVYALTNRDVPAACDKALELLGDTWGLIIDLRFNSGGDELLARQFAGRFLDKNYTYGYSQIRNGPTQTDLTEKRSRSCGPRGPWRYQGRVVVLTGQRTTSGAESLVLMLASAPQVVTMGDRTAGSSGSPRQLNAGLGITVTVPRRLDLGPDGKPFDTVGIEPRIPVRVKPGDFKWDKDPVLEKALEYLRKVPASARKPGRPTTTAPANTP